MAALRRITGLMLLVLLGFCGTSQASLVLVTTPGGLSPNDSIDWGQLGPSLTVLSSSESVSSAGGLHATVSTTDPAGLIRLDQGAGWSGNFAPGDKLINNRSVTYFPLTITFANSISGAGANIQLDDLSAFTATIEAFNGNTSLGSFTENGVSNHHNDGSAIFIGVLDTTQEITKIVFGIQNPPDFLGDFAINSLRLNENGPLNPVPEPSTAVVAVFGAVAFLAYGSSRHRRERRRQASA